MIFDDDKKRKVRQLISERVAWAIFHQNQLELGLMIEDHYRSRLHLSFDERETVCDAWNLLEEVLEDPEDPEDPEEPDQEGY